MIGNSGDETNLPHKLLLTNKQVANLRKVFSNYLSTDNKLSKTQLSKKIKPGGFLGTVLSPIIQPLAKSVLIPLGVTAVALAADAGIHKNS